MIFITSIHLEMILKGELEYHIKPVVIENYLPHRLRTASRLTQHYRTTPKRNKHGPLTCMAPGLYR